ncbi:MAG: hypothetical protein WDW36_008755 [Sanguina aurantia]
MQVQPAAGSVAVQSPDSAGSSTLLFLGGIAVGSAVAFGVAFGVSQYYVKQLGVKEAERQARKLAQPDGVKKASSRLKLPSSSHVRSINASVDMAGGPVGSSHSLVPAKRVQLPALPGSPRLSQKQNHPSRAAPTVPPNASTFHSAAHHTATEPLLYPHHAQGGGSGQGPQRSAPSVTNAPFPPAKLPAGGFAAFKVAASVPSGLARNLSGGNLQALAAAAVAGPASASATHSIVQQAAAVLGSHQMVLAGMQSVPHSYTELPDMSMYDDYSRVITPEMAQTEEMEEVCSMLMECMEMRKKWLFTPAQVGGQGDDDGIAAAHTRFGAVPTLPAGPMDRRNEPEAAVPSDLNPNPLEYRPMGSSTHTYKMVDGVMQVYDAPSGDANLFPVPGSANAFFTEMHRVLRFSSIGPVKSYCHHRLMLLEQKFNLHTMLNSDKENAAQKAAPHRDFYNVRKVDTHIHHSACMHQKHLLRFIKSKLRKEPDEVVIFRDGKYLTLKEVFESLKMTGYVLNVDMLDMHADKNMFHRFDRFNLKYNPCGQSRLREIFIKQDNLIHGRFLAEITAEVFADMEASKYQHAELRVSIYGRKAMEWDILAAWVLGNKLYSDNNVWLIQIPRLYNIYKDTGIIQNFQQMLDNIFEPLFEVTVNPGSRPQLHVLLSQIVGFDMVDDESKPERRPTKHCPPPKEWDSKHNCAYSYYAYYIYANLYALNKLPFMCCENIAHGINLRKSPCVQYLYYLTQIGLCMSPLSNNSLFLDYHRNPFPTFFARGLSVSLSTDDPLQIHLTKEPLVEEYSVAAQVWKLSSADLCEIARSGVLHSGFPHACKKHWVAQDYWRAGAEGNDIHKTNVPNLRLRFRHDTHCDEMRMVLHGALCFQTRKAMQSQRD